MSDTLRERLDRMAALMHYAGNHRDAATVEETIAELDRLEAEVKKPRLPEGYTVDDDQYRNITVYWKGDVVRHVFPDNEMHPFVEAFLTTPDVVPSTEPVQAAGDGAGEKDLSFAHKIGFSTGQTVLLHMLRHRIDAALERLCQETPPDFDDSLTGINAAWDAVRGVLAAMDITHAEVPNQDKDYQTPTKQEEKPKPVPLADEVHRTKPRWAHGGVVHENEFYHALDVIDARLRTLDQERGV